ncbi:MAG: hypothetical protein ACFFG0_03860 [Candidatus Thorarchaeota archaeon]
MNPIEIGSVACKGCYKYRTRSCYMRSGFFSLDNKPVNCPCIICLVKPMCLEVCDELGNYSSLLYNTLSKLNNGRVR